MVLIILEKRKKCAAKPAHSKHTSFVALATSFANIYFSEAIAMGELKSHAHSYGQNCFHLILSPKYRISMFKPDDIRRVCEGSLRMIAVDNGYIIHELKVMNDHVHLFLEIPPRVSVSEACQMLKGVSSRMLRRNFPWLRKFSCLWSNGKFYRSVGNVTSDVIEHYISKSQRDWDYFNHPRKYGDFLQARLRHS